MSSGAPELVPRVLEEYGAKTRAALERWLAPREPRRHLWEPAADYPSRGGRMLRSSLLIAATRAFGGRLEEALGSAVALELMHNAFLVHDDVEDESDERRGRPTLHALHGVPVAVNVGDALALSSLRPLLENRATLGPHLAWRVVEEVERTARESVEGQAIELGWRRDNVAALEDDDYLEMILKKTCWYTTIHPLRAGALIGSRDGFDLERLVRLGFFLGAAFQIEDDLLNLVGDRRRYGKEIDGDLWEGKRTLMLIHAQRHAAPEEREQLARMLAAPRSRRRLADVLWMRKLMDTLGSLEYAREVAHGLAGAAQHEFEQVLGALPDSRDKSFLAALPVWVLQRS